MKTRQSSTANRPLIGVSTRKVHFLNWWSSHKRFVRYRVHKLPRTRANLRHRCNGGGSMMTLESKTETLCAIVDPLHMNGD